MDFSPKSLYIHIPYCLSKCSYCDFFSTPVNSVPDEYIESLCRELKFRLNEKKDLRTVYIGGGTPSLLKPLQLKKISDLFFSDSIEEFTMEMNPDDITEDLLFAAADSGVNRISLGLQSLADNVLSFCNRRAKRSQIEKAVALIDKIWKGRLSYDLISGLPGENEKTFFEGLEFVCNTKADHLSLYSLTIEESTPLGKAIDCGSIDYNYEFADSLWIQGRDFLESKGFHQYEVSNFCKEEAVSLHNLSYWNHLSYIGCGAGATGTVYKSDGTGFRWTNTNNLKDYISCTDSDFDKMSDTEKLDVETEKFEFFMMGLRTLKGVSEKTFQQYFGTRFPKKFLDLFHSWVRDKKAQIVNIDGENFYSLGSDGILFLNQFLQELL